MRSNRKNSVLGSCNENIANSHPLVPRCWVILKHLQGKTLLGIRVIFTWETWEPVQPPVILTLPRTSEALAATTGLGREARGVQAGAPRRRVSTEKVSYGYLSVNPPATTNACKVNIFQVMTIPGSPRWKEEQHRHGAIYSPVVEGAPPQSR